MKTLLKNGQMLNVFTLTTEPRNILLEDTLIAGIGDYTEEDLDPNTDIVIDCTGCIISPSFIDGHIHIESTMLLPAALAKACIPHGTGAIVADPHEIANVCGTDGITYMLEKSEGLPMDIFITVPSCVPASSYEENYAEITARDIEPFFDHPRVIGLAEMMSYPDVVSQNPEVMAKIEAARRHNVQINGHAPLLSGRDLDQYILAGIYDDHECSNMEEALEKFSKGQRIMICEGTASRHLEDLAGLFQFPYLDRIMLVSDDKHTSDLMEKGHIDHIVRKAISIGIQPEAAYRAASLGAAQGLGLQRRGAIAPGYLADLLILSDLEQVKIDKVLKNGKVVYSDGQLAKFPEPECEESVEQFVRDTFHTTKFQPEQFRFDETGIQEARIIQIQPGSLITESITVPVDFDMNQGINVDPDQDIVKIAVAERHHNTGHIGLGLLQGSHIQRGAIASSVSHDAHNLVILGADEKDMSAAANAVLDMKGGQVVVLDGQVIAAMPLPVAGLMSELEAEEAARQNEDVVQALKILGPDCPDDLFMKSAFMCLSVIPHLKICTRGLIDVDSQQLVEIKI